MTQDKYHRAKLKFKPTDDPVLRIIIEYNGLKPQKNGAYEEELQDLRYPYKNKTSGTNIDVLTDIINEELNTDYSQNDIVEYVQKYFRNSIW